MHLPPHACLPTSRRHEAPRPCRPAGPSTRRRAPRWTLSSSTWGAASQRGRRAGLGSPVNARVHCLCARLCLCQPGVPGPPPRGASVLCSGFLSCLRAPQPCLVSLVREQVSACCMLCMLWPCCPRCASPAGVRGAEPRALHGGAAHPQPAALQDKDVPRSPPLLCQVSRPPARRPGCDRCARMGAAGL